MASELRSAPDPVLIDIADYVFNYKVRAPESIAAARLCLTDTLAGAFDALDFPECTRLIGPVVPGTIVPQGARVPGTPDALDPDTAAFSLGCMIRWLDYNDAFNAAQGIHPSDTLAGILTLADHLSRRRVARGQEPLLIRDVLESLIKAYEIEGCIALKNNFGETAMVDHTLLDRVASSAVLTYMLGGSREHIVNAVSNAFMDASLIVYRRANPGSRKNWACADAISQAMRISRMAVQGEMGYSSVLTAKREGFYDARFHGKPFKFQRPYGEYIIQHSNFKFVAAGMHSQTAVECAFQLHPLVQGRLDDIDRIDARCSHALIAAGIDHNGPLYSPADRDHCAAYNIAVSLIHGELNACDYEDDFAADPRIDKLRAKIVLTEDLSYTQGFHDPAQRSNASSLQIWFKSGSSTPKIEIEYPAGHWRRRATSMPVLRAKFAASLSRTFLRRHQERILGLYDDGPKLERTPVNEFLDLLVHDLEPGRQRLSPEQ